MASIYPPFHILDTVDSTNNYAMGKVHEGMAKCGSAWFALEQTAGKGQRTKSWNSTKSQNIILSLAWQPKLPVSQQFRLSMAAALAAVDLFKTYAGDDTKIKWPNDLYWGDRKAGGILIENKLKGSQWDWAVIGIGININQDVFDSHLPNPVSLRQITGKQFDIIEMGKALQSSLILRLESLEKVNPYEMLKEYNALLFRLSEPVKLKKGSQVFSTVITGVAENGMLHTKDAIDRSFDFGEVEFLLDK